jgi:hypothetical protein
LGKQKICWSAVAEDLSFITRKDAEAQRRILCGLAPCLPTGRLCASYFFFFFSSAATDKTQREMEEGFFKT